MDSLAKAFLLWRQPFPRVEGQRMSPEEWSISFRGQRVSSSLSKSLRQLIEANKMETMWTTPRKQSSRRPGKPAKFRASQIETIDLESVKKAWSEATGCRRRFVVKLGADRLPVGRNMRMMKFWKHDRCPCCKEKNETFVHLLLCTDKRAVSNREVAILKFEERLKKLKTLPRIRQTIVGYLQHCLLGNPLPSSSDTDEIGQALHLQIQAGRWEMLYGRWAKAWRTLQDKVFPNYAPMMTGSRWAIGLVAASWDLSFDIWDGRNNILHQSDMEDTVLNMDEIDLQILEEWSMGLTGIPDQDQFLFHGLTVDDLLAKSGVFRREWLACATTARYGEERE
jgi:hypothetical protein